MELQKKIEILSAAAKYDVSCSSSGSKRKNTTNTLGNAHTSGICHSWSADGRCISLLKILLTNYCIYDCVYCVNRASNDIPRASFTPDEVADLTIGFYRRNYIEGLFLSSAVIKNPDHTMELILKVVKKLREEYCFNGYIHIKAIPGADLRIINEAGTFADRMSVNIELPSNEGLKLLAPQKSKEAIIKPMGFITNKIDEKNDERRVFKKAKSFVPAGQSTQLIIGATPDHDFKILKLSEGLYNRYRLKRVYYSAFVPVVKHPDLPAMLTPPLLREHRLYQADWLLRFYGFKADELLNDENSDFDIDLDPKSYWAMKNMNYFPMEINRVDFNSLLRIPGIGVRSAQKIITARRVGILNFEDLKKLGVVIKRARYFITCNGKFFGEKNMNEFIIRQSLITSKPKALAEREASQWKQISIFDVMPQVEPEINYLSMTGEI